MSSVPPITSALQEFAKELTAATTARDKKIAERQGNMFYGPITVEEYIQICVNDIRLLTGAVNGLVAILVEKELAEQQPPA